ncbi:MAG TPA: peptidylprolyl isomerase [Candidatus Dormibacteraeota bacterium]|nr:peptidylprolyl isomerase [Candidatus Dormibacteraeota bacterium]
MKKPRVTKLPLTIRRSFKPKATEERVSEALQSVPRITNETVAEHREEVLASARKFIYPLQHSKHRVVGISSWLFLIVLTIFFAYSGVALYKFQLTNGFIYGVTKVVPFPVAKAGPSWVNYESYLFELRHYMYYYHTQQKVDFSTADGKAQLTNFKTRSLNQVIDDAYIKQLASHEHITVSQQEVNNEVALVSSQNRLGSDPKVLQTVLNEFWGWNVSDFKRELSQQLLAQKVVAKLDTSTQGRAKQALAELKSGQDFATLASQLSDDQNTKSNGGEYPNLISQSDSNIDPQITAALFSLKAGQYSGIINTGYSLEIVKVLDIQGPKVHAAHISFNFKDISNYINPLKAKEKTERFIKV